MEVSLRPSTAERVRSALGEDVSLSPQDVPAVLARLAVEAPDVYSQVLAEISGSHVRLDSERALKRRWRRGLIRRALFGWGEYESDAGDRLIAKRHVAAAVPIGLAVVILMLFGVSHLVGHRSAPTAGRSPARVVARITPLHPVPERAVRDAAPSQWQPPAPAPPPLLDPVAPPPAPWAQSLPLPPIRSSSAVEAASHANPVVFTRQPVPEGTHLTAALRPDSSGPPSPIVYDRAASDAAESPRAGAATPSAAAPSAAAPHDEGGASAHPPVIAGQRVPARLSTGVVVVAGGPAMPVVAESTDPATRWLGHATLGSEGLVQITFTSQGGGRAAATRGVALDPARLVPGLAGRTALRHPQAAGMVLTTALQAATDYVQALARQGQVTLVDGWAQLVDGSPAPAWTYVASRLAQGLNLQGSAGTPVATTELDAGTPLVILLTEAP